jgi:chromosome partitioning protein
MLMLSGQILDAMITSCENAKTVLRQAAIDPSDRKTLNISMGASVAAEFLGRTPEALSKAEARGRLPAPKTAANGRRFYTVEDLIAIREALGIKMGKLPAERAVVIAVQNFKGGVSKSTTGKHLADYLALRGYRVLVVDCDPQASMSVMFDVNLEALVDETHTLSNFLSPRIDEANSLRKTIQKTAWPNIDICPANLGLQDTEWELTATIEEGPTAIAGAFRMLRIGLEEVRLDYDVVILDPPPAMGFLGVNTLTAADGLLIPVPARQLDYLSTIHFMQTCREAVDLVSKFDTSIDYGFIGLSAPCFSPVARTRRRCCRSWRRPMQGKCFPPRSSCPRKSRTRGYRCRRSTRSTSPTAHTRPTFAAGTISTWCSANSRRISASNGRHAWHSLAPID